MSEKLYISRTKKEWETIEQKLSQIGKSDLASFINRKVYQLEKEYKKCPQCVCEIVEDRKQKKISVSYPKVLQKISVKTGKPISTVLDRLIIEPLLLGDYTG